MRTVLTQVYEDSSTPTKRTSHPTILSAHIKGTAGNEKKKKKRVQVSLEEKKKPDMRDEFAPLSCLPRPPSSCNLSHTLSPSIG